jgi:hypothetical protein
MSQARGLIKEASNSDSDEHRAIVTANRTTSVVPKTTEVNEKADC